MTTLRNDQGLVFRCDDDRWATALTIARENGWASMDPTDPTVCAGDAVAFADAIEDAPEDFSDLVAFLRRGGFRLP